KKRASSLTRSSGKSFSFAILIRASSRISSILRLSICSAFSNGINLLVTPRVRGIDRDLSNACGKDFSITSGTLFASHKLPLRCYLAAIAIFCNEVKGKSALALSRDLNVSYKCAFVLLHKLREGMAAELKGRMIGGEG